ncbi:MAG: 4Fe-4S dicluster domain-containing protein [Fimbriimonadaceae bacterium]|uniref:Molybdopterin oxidoreductase n=1 Tax=Candidatus Nitrosymbiomonas proteolyticus TaxID=2608984 RepID=A0A809S4T1_9BACT|nr:4Fe-4S dicluster domain-containing protein [Fimbriimonadaceae bacterium]NUM39214.1 4Fe-4S dicluster domain-containing protein [Armatimonadota bacterium]BBO23817.1 molybdopterin oxidoreductase [Candidatus Nitrosymbiomonas proteolyticus]
MGTNKSSIDLEGANQGLDAQGSSPSPASGPEFSPFEAPWSAPFDRRRFLQIVGASMAMAGLAGCRPKLAERIVPYVKAPEEILPGDPVFYATALTLSGYATGVLVKSETGRPIKVEGNPDHPGSLGATDVFAQAAILGLYDPDRSQEVRLNGQKSNWSVFVAAAQKEFARLKSQQGKGLAILTETVTSPTFDAEIQSLLAELPEAKWYCYEPFNREVVFAGAKLALGVEKEPLYRLENADVIVLLDSDFLYISPGRTPYTKQFAARRKIRKAKQDLNRLYAVESTPTVSGAFADHRLSVKAGEIGRIAAALAEALGVPGPASGGVGAEIAAWVKAMAEDLQAHRGRCVVVPGETQPAQVHALAHAINEALGAFGKTVEFIDPVPYGDLYQTASLKSLVAALDSGAVESLLILGGNPAFSAPADVPFTEAVAKARFTVHVGLYADETYDASQWHIPMAHELEAWGDAKAFDGTAAIQQPLIEPLYGGRSCLEVLSAFRGRPTDGREIVRSFWNRDRQNFDTFWTKSLNDGFVSGSAPPSTVPQVKAGWFAGAPGLKPAVVTGVEINFRPDPCIYDGRFANNAWLQELFKPITKVCWDNVAVMSQATAEKFGLWNRVGPTGKELLVSLCDVTYRGRTLTRVPVWIQAGQPDDSITIHLGYGRLRAGKVGSSVGFNAYALRVAAAPGFEDGAKVTARSERYSLATNQVHSYTEGRKELTIFDAEEFGHEEAHGEAHGPISLYPDRPYEGYAWAMVFDTNVCTGCNACIVACQAENNIPTVGKTDVLRGRDMHWIRIDRYYLGADSSEVHHMPVNCMHCEKAPCEVVCPVAATVHSSEGLNEMVYNRCVGTRYCSNNCPYKARRFNFRQFTDKHTPVLKLMRNPDVTVRGRGVMEKCTYCVQRINSARKTAKKENRPIRDGEIMTACQAACPAGGIVFGNLNDPASAVAQLRTEPHHYTLLEELNTRPRTTYLARYKNRNTTLVSALEEFHSTTQ